LLTPLVASCSPTVPTRRDVVLGIAGEPRAILSDEPSAQILQAAVTESLVRRDPDGGFVARLATEVPTIANGGARVVTDATAPNGRLVRALQFSFANGKISEVDVIADPASLVARGLLSITL